MYVELNNHIVGKWRCIFTLFPIDTSTLDLAVSLESCHDRPCQYHNLHHLFPSNPEMQCHNPHAGHSKVLTNFVGVNLWPMCLFWTNCCNWYTKWTSNQRKGFQKRLFFYIACIIIGGKIVMLVGVNNSLTKMNTNS